MQLYLFTLVFYLILRNLKKPVRKNIVGDVQRKAEEKNDICKSRSGSQHNENFNTAITRLLNK